MNESLEISGDKAYEIYEKACLIHKEKVPPSCMICGRQTGYIQDTLNPAVEYILKNFVNFDYFLLEDKVYIRIKRCAVCEAYSLGRYPELDTTHKIPEYQPIGVDPETERSRKVKFERGRQEYLADLESKSKPKSKTSSILGAI